MTASRPSGRAPDQLRDISFDIGYTQHAEGSVLATSGDTRVLCTASIEDGVPRFLRGKGSGWITSEYGMLPRSTHTRSAREASRGKQSGRTQEIQRLIGRSLRATSDLVPGQPVVGALCAVQERLVKPMRLLCCIRLADLQSLSPLRGWEGLESMGPSTVRGKTGASRETL